MAREPFFLTNFDSASGLVRAAGAVLHGSDFPALGQSRALEPLARAASLLPAAVRERLFALSGATEGIWSRRLGSVDAEAVAAWAAAQYPERQFPAVAIGSSNGTLPHLAAAFDMPWLPQTFLTVMRHLSNHPDRPKDALEHGRRHAPALLKANPDIQLHHLFDPNQDRLMVRYIDHFRMKRRRLGPAYESFLRERLAPGGTILLIECTYSWPTKRVRPRHVFQLGGAGGAPPEEYIRGSPRVAEYLARYGSKRREWDAPEPDEESPEAEWGFEPALREDVLRFARAHGFAVKRLVFNDPMDLSPLVADFHRDWYRERGIEPARLLVESFMMVEPTWTLRTGSVPFWLTFNMNPSAECLDTYLASSEAWDEIRLVLFQNGVEGIGYPPPERWQEIIGRHARREGSFIGTRPDRHPRDLGAFARYHTAMKALPERHAMPDPLPLERLESFLAKDPGRYRVELHDA